MVQGSTHSTEVSNNTVETRVDHRVAFLKHWLKCKTETPKISALSVFNEYHKGWATPCMNYGTFTRLLKKVSFFFFEHFSGSMSFFFFCMAHSAFFHFHQVEGKREDEAIRSASTRKAGRPTTLPDHLEKRIADFLYDAIHVSRIPVTLHWVKVIVMHQVLHYFGKKKFRAVMKRCSGRDWFKQFQKRYPFLGTVTRRRPIEQHHAMKARPEVTVKYFRILLHTYALMMIHRGIATG
jgi:hypothetical protein